MAVSHTILLPQPTPTNRPALNLAADTIEKATITGEARRVMVPQEVPVWLAGQITALAEASRNSPEHNTHRYGQRVANLLEPRQEKDDWLSATSELDSVYDTAEILLAYAILADAPNTEDLLKFYFYHGSYPDLRYIGLGLSIEIHLLSESIAAQPLKNLGKPVDYGLYHERSHTIIPFIRERGIITAVEPDLFNDPEELAAEAKRLIDIYNSIARDENLEPLSQVGFYTRDRDDGLGSITQCKVIDTSLF